MLRTSDTSKFTCTRISSLYADHLLALEPYIGKTDIHGNTTKIKVKVLQIEQKDEFLLIEYIVIN